MMAPGRLDLFEFNLPKSFFPEHIENKYKAYLDRIPNGFNTVRKYINRTIQGIVIPDMSFDPAVQNSITLDVGFRSGLNIQNLFNKDFEVVFKLTDGWINMFMLMEIFAYHYSKTNPNNHLDPFRIFTVDSKGIKIASIVLEQPLFTGLNGLSPNFSESNQDFATFSAKFTFNKFKIEILGLDNNVIANDFGNNSN